MVSPGTPVSSINKTDGHNIAEMLLQGVLNTITLALLHSLVPVSLDIPLLIVRLDSPTKILTVEYTLLPCQNSSWIIVADCYSTAWYTPFKLY